MPKISLRWAFGGTLDSAYINLLGVDYSFGKLYPFFSLDVLGVSIMIVWGEDWESP